MYLMGNIIEHKLSKKTDFKVDINLEVVLLASLLHLKAVLIYLLILTMLIGHIFT